MSRVQFVVDSVRTGQITAEQGALLLELMAQLDAARTRRAMWREVRDLLSFGPLRRWLARRRDFPTARVL